MPTNEAATRWPHYHEDDLIIRDYRFASGEVLPELRLHYRTIGEPFAAVEDIIPQYEIVFSVVRPVADRSHYSSSRQSMRS